MNIPVIHVRGKTIAEGYERAVYALYKEGCEIATQYDRPGDPLSKDCTLNLVIDEPEADPMIHKAFPGGIEDLRAYVMELHGDKDEWVKNQNDPDDKRWEYTYHGRFVNYDNWKEIDLDPTSPSLSNFKSRWVKLGINQKEWVINKLIVEPYTRQAQMITWMPSLDMECYDPPCLQSIWFRILEDKNGMWILNTNIRIRSNDAWGANFMNMFGLMRFVRTIGDEISKKSGHPVCLGRLNWQADSYHIYGKDIKDVKARLIDKIEGGQPFEKRVWNFNSEMIQEMYTECVPNILNMIKTTEAGFDK